MIKYAILLAVICASVWAFYIEESEEVLSPILILEDEQPPPESDIQVQEFVLPPGWIRCMPTMCCKSKLRCGPSYSCLDPVTNKFATNMEPCL